MRITSVRSQLAADDSLVGRELCRVWSEEVDRWLAELVEVAAEPHDQGLALVAVGGYGRSELSLQSDLDVILLHAGRRDIGELADRIWYPIWDEGMKLGHSVRTVKEALALAADDLDTATSLLDTRHLAGDRTLGMRKALTCVSAGQGLVLCLNTERTRRDSNPKPSDP